MKITFKTLVRLSTLVAILGLYSCDEDDTVQDEASQTIDCPDFVLENAIINEDGSAVSYTVIGSNEDAIYEWTVNDEVLSVNDNTNTVLEYTFPEAGNYTVCVKNINEACSEAIEQCVESIYEGNDDVVIIEEPAVECEISFVSTVLERQNTSSSNYVFEATALDSESDVKYFWTVNDEDQNDNDTTLNFTFTENGTYEVCVFSETPECPFGVESCATIVIDSIEEDNTTALYTITALGFEQNKTLDACIDLTYTYSIDGDTIILEAAEFDGLVDGNYVWFRGNEPNPINSIGTGRTIEFEFRDNGFYTFCVFVETPDCPNSVSYCGNFSVELGIIVN